MFLTDIRMAINCETSVIETQKHNLTFFCFVTNNTVHKLRKHGAKHMACFHQLHEHLYFTAPVVQNTHMSQSGPQESTHKRSKKDFQNHTFKSGPEECVQALKPRMFQLGIGLFLGGMRWGKDDQQQFVDFDFAVKLMTKPLFVVL